MYDALIDKLLKSREPAVRYKVHSRVLGLDPNSGKMKRLQQAIKKSERVQTLLEGITDNNNDNVTNQMIHPYNKWRGAHWVLSILADLEYPPGDKSLIPLREQVYNWLFSEKHQKSIRRIKGRVRRCASQESNLLYSLHKLGLADDDRVYRLAEILIEWQWPDGGWNCDKHPEVCISSFMESLIPLRALALHAQVSGSGASSAAADRAAEIFLKRKMFRRVYDGSIMRDEFVKLHYPCYWHYDILFGLKVMAEADYIMDKRCIEALDLLQTKQLAGDLNGFPAEKKYYQVIHDETSLLKYKSGVSCVDWGGTSIRKMNEFVTVDALYVLVKAGRLSKIL